MTTTTAVLTTETNQTSRNVYSLPLVSIIVKHNGAKHPPDIFILVVLTVTD